MKNPVNRSNTVGAGRVSGMRRLINDTSWLRQFLTAILMLIAMAPVAHAVCVVQPVASVPLGVSRGAITVPLKINGGAATFILDTGAQRSVVTQDAVDRLGLARDQWVGTTMNGVGGIQSRPNADPTSLSLGGVPLVRRTLTHDTSLTVGVLPHALAGNLVIDGLLGRDFLSLFDLDLDVPDRRLLLYRVSACSGRFLPWTGDYAAIPATMPTDTALVVPVSLDGRPLRALLDTGASASLLSAPGMFKLGLTAAALDSDPADTVNGLGPRSVTVHRHQFHTLGVGAEVIDSPRVWVEPIRLAPIVDMLLGADWLAGRRVWISLATRQLFVLR